ncbi:MAG: ABC transporter permease [Lutisporaceae bacterium]
MKLNLSEHSRITLVKYLISFILTMVLGGLLVLVQGESPVEAVKAIVVGAFGSKINIGNSIRWSIPCMIAGAAATVAFRSGVMNLGLEGQIYFGAISGALAGAYVSLPHVPHVVICIVAAGLAGALYTLLPAFLRLFFKVDEMITTLMLNFVATLMTEYITIWFIMGGNMSANGSASIATPQISRTAELSTIVKGTTANTGFFIGVTTLLLIAFFFKYTVQGYSARQAGQNMSFAKVGGVNVLRNYISMFLVSGFIAGMCGGIEVSGSYHRFTANFSPNLGWEGMMVTRVAENNPIALIFVSFIWGVLKAGSMHMERVTTLNRLTVNLIQMFFVILVSIDYDLLFRAAQEKFRKRREKKEVAL